MPAPSKNSRIGMMLYSMTRPMTRTMIQPKSCTARAGSPSPIAIVTQQTRMIVHMTPGLSRPR